MKNSNRLLALLLALFMLVSTACSSSQTDTEGKETQADNAAATTAAEETEDPTLRANAKDNLPADLNFDGTEIRFFYRNIDPIANYDLVGTENTGELVFDAVYTRNRSVEERLGVTLKMIPSSGTSIADVRNQITKSVSSSSDEFDVVVATGNTLPQSGLTQYLMNLIDDPYLDYDQPWWWNDAMDELSLNPKISRYYLIGDFLLYNLLSTSAMYFNKELYTNKFGDPNDLYNTVLEGNWTYDKMAEYVKAGYEDLNGNSKEDDEDLYAMVLYSGAGNILQLQYSTDIPSYTRDEDGFPVLSPADTRTAKFAESMLAIMEMPGCATGLSETEIIERFVESKTLFLPYRLTVSFDPSVRAMTTDFGIIPYPKLDENQKDYISMIHDCSSDAAIPKTNTIMEATTATLEALNAESYRSVTEKFYETALKTKYVRDDISSQIIDIIRDTATKDLMNEYQALLNGFGHKLATSIAGGKNTVASDYAKNITSANKYLEKLIEKETGN
ncbi:MAG: hypothetical protein J6I45_06380 [Clostridia bacterium]|nr:hypothetical protein [Clostridia bacterium]